MLRARLATRRWLLWLHHTLPLPAMAAELHTEQLECHEWQNDAESAIHRATTVSWIAQSDFKCVL